MKIFIMSPLDSYNVYNDIDSGIAYYLFKRKFAGEKNAQWISIFFGNTVIEEAG